MLTATQNPTLVDILMVTAMLRQWERDYSINNYGEGFNHEQLAVLCFNVDGPKWVIRNQGTPVAVIGFIPMRVGVWEAWAISTDEAWTRPIDMARNIRAAINVMFEDFGAHRVQHIILEGAPVGPSWYRSVGLGFEGKMLAWGAKGEDALVFARTEKKNAIPNQ